MAQDERPKDELAADPDPTPESDDNIHQGDDGPQLEPESEAAPTDGRRTSVIIALSVVGGLLAIYLIAVLSTVGGVPDNTSVAGIGIGGLSESEAAAVLADGLADAAVAPITVTALQSESALDPTEVGLLPDYPATADIASGPIFNPVRLFKHISGQTVEVAPVVDYDAAAMQDGVVAFATSADQVAVEPQIKMDPSTPKLAPGEAGQGIDQQAAIDLVVASYLFTQGPIELPLTTLAPTVSDEEAQQVLDDYAVPAVSGPVRMTFDSTSENLVVATISEGLSFSPAEGTLQPQLNLEVIRAGLPQLAAAEDPGTDATWNVSSGTPVVVPSKQGRGVTDTELTDQTLAVLPKTNSDERTAALTIVAIDPQLTTEAAQALNITDQLSSFTQKFDYAEYREVNVGKAAEYMNGTVLKPGDTYSMNGTIKERTEANGYVEGTFISNGRFEQGLGGGVSIATTATWTAAFFAAMEAIEVNPHSLYISRYQPGLEATVAWGQLDLKFRNDSPDGVLITTESGGTFITVTMWGTKRYEKVDDVSSERYDITKYPTVTDDAADCTSQGGVDGFTIDVWRVFYNGGKEVDREKFTTNYDPTTKVVCAPPPAPTPAPVPTPAG